MNRKLDGHSYGSCQRYLACIAGAVVLSTSLTHGALAQDPRTIDPVDRAEEYSAVSTEARAILTLDPEREIVISNEMVVDTWLLVARRLVFEPGGRLVFSENALQARDEFFIIADSIEVTDRTSPPVITWAKPTAGQPNDRGQAASGASGSGWGAAGANGANGARGATGASGRDGPDLTIFVKNPALAALLVDMSGADAGKGGRGQAGGNGGAGHQGNPARNERISLPFRGSTDIGCAAGPGRGGRGGNGGSGGVGGIGGSGGRGGDVTVISLSDTLPTLTRAFRIDLSGGKGGPGGPGGAGGTAGAGGPEGPRTSWCGPAGRRGASGSKGMAGNTGSSGDPGRAGDFYVGTLAPSQFEGLYGL